MFDKLRQIESRYEEFSARLAEAANAPGGRTEYARLAKAAAEIEPVVTAFGQYKNVLARIEEANHILGEAGDPELSELAGQELEDLRVKRAGARGAPADDAGAPGRARRQERPRRDPGGRRRGRGRALRRRPRAHVHQVRRAPRLPARGARHPPDGPGRVQGGHPVRPGQGRLEPPEVRAGRASRPAGARDGVRGPHPHLHRDGRGPSRGRGRRREGRRQGPQGGRLPLVGARGPGRQHHRLGGAHHAPADGARRDLPGRALADQEPGEGHAGAPGAPARAGAGGAALADRRGAEEPGRDGRAQRADPHLQLPAGARDGSPHRAHGPPAARRPRGRSRRAGRGAARGGADRAARSRSRHDARPSLPRPGRPRPRRSPPPSGPPGIASPRQDSPPPGRMPRCSWPGRSARRGSASTRAAGRRCPAPGSAVFEALVARRTRHEPIQYLLGEVEFCGLALGLGPGVFIPRPETEGLVERALALGPPEGATVLDLCTGSGAVACALAARRPGWTVWAVERAGAGGRMRPGERAAPRARRARPGARGRSLRAARGCRAARAPWISWWRTRPTSPRRILPALPVEVRDWEPREALDGGPDGLDGHSPAARRCARSGFGPGGGLLAEIGEEQGPAARALVAADGAVSAEACVHRDFRGCERVLEARRR